MRSVDSTSETVVICEHSALQRKGLEALFRSLKLGVIVAETGSAIFSILKEPYPDWIVVDPDSIEVDLLKFCERIKVTSPSSRLMIYSTVYVASRFCERLSRAGVHAVVLKRSPYDVFVDALKNHEKTWLDPTLAEVMSPKACTKFSVFEEQAWARLSSPNSEIAEELDVSVDKIADTVSKLIVELQVPSRTAALLAAVHAGLELIPIMCARDESGKTHDEIQAEANAREILGW